LDKFNLSLFRPLDRALHEFAHLIFGHVEILACGEQGGLLDNQRVAYGNIRFIFA
jgi:hypothetical protein